jgi:hypothetical protein
MSFKKALANAKKKTKGKTDPKKGMGFKAAQKKIMEKGKSQEAAGAILAEGARNASPFAKAKNRNLKKVK